MGRRSLLLALLFATVCVAFSSATVASSFMRAAGVEDEIDQPDLPEDSMVELGTSARESFAQKLGLKGDDKSGCFPDMATCQKRAEEKGGKCCNGGGCIARCEYADGVCCATSPYCCKKGYQCAQKKGADGKEKTVCRRIKKTSTDDKKKPEEPKKDKEKKDDAKKDKENKKDEEKKDKKKDKKKKDKKKKDKKKKKAIKEKEKKKERKEKAQQRREDKKARNALKKAKSMSKSMNSKGKKGAARRPGYRKVGSLPMDGRVINIFSHVVVNTGKNGKASIRNGKGKKKKRGGKNKAGKKSSKKTTTTTTTTKKGKKNKKNKNKKKKNKDVPPPDTFLF